MKIVAKFGSTDGIRFDHYVEAWDVEYAGYKKGDFRIDSNTVIEVGGGDKGFSQLEGQANSSVAADDIESASMRKIPLWAFGFLY